MSINKLSLLALLATVTLSFTYTDAHAYSCRKQSVKHRFDVQQGYSNGRDGYIVDHTCALAQGGIDHPSNMQYQTELESKEKDRIENTPAGKRIYCNAKNSTVLRKVYNCRHGKPTVAVVDGD